MDDHTLHDRGRRRLLGCVACGGFSLLLAAARPAQASTEASIGSLPALGDPAHGLLPRQLEARLGERIMAELRTDPSYLDDPLLRDYLQGIAERLTPASREAAEPEAPRDFDLFLLRDSTFNAFALPGGHIGFFTGLVADAQSEPQLAAVLAHEQSHVTQRHIAQAIAASGTDSLLVVGSIVLAVLAAMANNAQAAQGLMMGGQAAASARALSFSRNNERDADRVGIGVLRASGYPPQAMSSMLQRLQDLMRLSEADVWAFLQTHPLNSERIADAQTRGGSQPLATETNLRFWLMNARARVLSLSKPQDLRELALQLRQPGPDRPADLPVQRAAWAYGESLAWLGAGDQTAAAKALDQAEAQAGADSDVQHLPLRLARGDLLLARRQQDAALALAQQLRELAPDSRAALYLQARALLAAPDPKPARNFLRQQTALRPRDIQLWNWLAQASAASGDLAAQHRATGEAYALQGNLDGAIEQLQIAQKTSGADFIDASIIDARLNALRQQHQRQQALDKQLQ